jgi:uncharacterized membrane protein
MKDISFKNIFSIIIIIFFVFSGFLYSINLVKAQTEPSSSQQSNSTEGATGSESGLVKCGVSRDCTICDIFILVRDIFNFALGLLAVLAVVSIVIGGVYILTSAGDSGKAREGYSIITNAVIGLLLVMSSFLLFSFVLVVLGFQSANFSAALDFQDGQIFSVKCDTASTFNARGQNGGGAAVAGGDAGKCGSTKCADKFASQIESAAKQQGVDPKLIQALIDTENADGSNCNPSAVRNESNGTKSCGILQLNSGGVAANCGISCEQAKDVSVAAACAAKELKKQGASTICKSANIWNPNACNKSCIDIKYTYCSRAKNHYDYYSKCSTK